MKKILSIITVSLFIFVLLPSAVMATGRNETRENVTVKKGRTFTVTVDDNPSTGYSWWYLMNPGEKNIKFVNVSYTGFSTDPNLVGGGGKEVFKFKATRKEETFIWLLQLPPSGDLSDAEWHLVNITVK